MIRLAEALLVVARSGDGGHGPRPRAGSTRPISLGGIAARFETRAQEPGRTVVAEAAGGGLTVDRDPRSSRR